jgi:hypothetical protein
MAGGLEFKMDLSEMRNWLTAWKKFPKAAGKQAANMINDMAFEFKKEFSAVISSRYKIRDWGFLDKIVTVEKARPRSHMSDIVARVGTTTIVPGGAHHIKNFSGFTEEITGQPDHHNPHDRIILPAGRVGKKWEGKAQGWARMHPGQRIPSIIDPALQNIPERQRFAALIAMMKSGKLQHSLSNVFILEGKKAAGGEYRRGLYRFKGGKLPVGEEFSRGKKRVEMIQSFREKTVLPPRWDWRELVMEKVQQKFTPDYMFENYIAKALNGIEPQKKPWPKT